MCKGMKECKFLVCELSGIRNFEITSAFYVVEFIYMWNVESWVIRAVVWQKRFRNNNAWVALACINEKKRLIFLKIM